MKHTAEKKKRFETPLSDSELDYFKSLILRKRDETLREADDLQKSLDNMMDSDEADSSANAHHMADVASDEESIQMYYRLIGRARSYLKQLDKALDRIDNRTYGVCKVSGKPIPKGRLEAVPHTRYGIEVKLRGLDKN